MIGLWWLVNGLALIVWAFIVREAARLTGRLKSRLVYWWHRR